MQFTGINTTETFASLRSVVCYEGNIMQVINKSFGVDFAKRNDTDSLFCAKINGTWTRKSITATLCKKYRVVVVVNLEKYSVQKYAALHEDGAMYSCRTDSDVRLYGYPYYRVADLDRDRKGGDTFYVVAANPAQRKRNEYSQLGDCVGFGINSRFFLKSHLVSNKRTLLAGVKLVKFQERSVLVPRTGYIDLKWCSIDKSGYCAAPQITERLRILSDKRMAEGLRRLESIDPIIDTEPLYQAFCVSGRVMSRLVRSGVLVDSLWDELRFANELIKRVRYGKYVSLQAYEYDKARAEQHLTKFSAIYREVVTNEEAY